MVRRLAHGCFVVLLLTPAMASALGLGSVETRSALNEPLDARIPLTASAEELQNLQVRLAPAEAFQRAGLDRPFMLSRLSFELVTDNGDEPYIQVTTENALREPFLAFLLDVRWSSGRLLREYTLLLDPPVYSPQQQAPAAGSYNGAARTRSDATDADATATTTGGRVSRPGAITETRGSSSSATPREYGAVRRNETAWDIAMQVRPDGSVSVHQMMMALVRANPNAFIDGNVNNLREGAILRIPSRTDIQSLSVADARREFSSQVEAWRAARTPALVEPAGQVSDTAAAEASDGRLQVVAAGQESGTDATASIADDEQEATARSMRRLEQELTALRESEAAMRAENEELRQMAQEMRQRMQILENSLNIPAEPDPVLTPPDEQSPARADQAQTVETTQTEAGEEAAPAPKAAEATATPQQAKPSPVVEPATPDPRAFWENPMLQMVGAGVLLVLSTLVALVMRRRRRARSEDEAILSGSSIGLTNADDDGVDEGTRDMDAVGGEAGASDDELIVDPLEQAASFMLDGCYDDAADAVNRGLTLDPDNPDLRLKMLEIHAHNQDRGAFEADAQGLFSLVEGQNDPVWQRASELGRDIAPENPLFSSGDDFDDAPYGDAVADADQLDTPLNLSGDDVEAEPVRGSDKESPDVASEQNEGDLSELDFSLDEPLEDEQSQAVSESKPAKREEPQPVADDLSMDFDLNAFTDSTPQQSPAEESAAPAALEDDGFGLDFDTTEQTADSSPAEQPISDADDKVLSFDLEQFGSGDVATEGDVATAPVSLENGDDEDELFDDADENGTKLDLARAYLDMGDAEGARSLLDEVLEEGSDEQKQEAQALVSQAK